MLEIARNCREQIEWDLLRAHRRVPVREGVLHARDELGPDRLGGAHRRDLAALGEPAERFLLELADALAGDAQDPADLLERLRLGGAVSP